MVYAVTGGAGRSVDTCCSTINFFVHTASAQAWIDAHPGVTATILGQDRAVALGREIFGPLLDDSIPGRGASVTWSMPGLRRLVSPGLTGLAGTPCLACCAIPLLLAAGVLGRAGWAVAGRWAAGIAVSLVALAARAWWRTARRRGHRGDCAGGGNCACAPKLSRATGS